MSFFRGLWKSSSKHKKLCEEWALANSRDCVESTSGSGSGLSSDHGDVTEATFTLKYLGSTLVETPSSEEATAEAIKTVMTMVKASGKKLQRVSLGVSLRGIRMTDLATEEDQLQVSIYRISYCSADAAHDHVFAFIATNLNETMECHAFLCPKRKTAQTVTLTVAQAFNTAYEAWQQSRADPRIHHPPSKTLNTIPLNNDKTIGKSEETLAEVKKSEKNLLIDLTHEVKPSEKTWVHFEDDSSGEMRKTTKKSTANGIPMATIRHTGSMSNHVVPRPMPGFKVQNAWGESRSVDLMCS
ncbi:low density lipoprotein receptor adapter protein 1 isoform X1 [Diachasma alloeum]|uniref:low density lipoprotein receptor adapter protein 1 isoform X1 n=1 Tax=Diachasma alloeum TaxID=454923 RepID=UPI00073815FD|nr:low density lipoprotein receptor adapter protein 1 isoform X1 [Diachasma alloeum]